MIDKRYLLPRESPWLEDPQAKRPAELSPEQKGPRGKRITSPENLTELWEQFVGWWKS